MKGPSRSWRAPEMGAAELRERMVATQLRARGIEDERVLAAFGTVPRHRFVNSGDLATRYDDRPLPIPCGQTISQPYIVALTLQAARIDAADRVLEIGAGSGYQTALLSLLARRVCALEYHQELAASARARLRGQGGDNVDLRCGDGCRGWPDGGPFDVIVGAAAAARIPQPLLEQLAAAGRLVMPVGVADQELVCLQRTETGFARRSLGAVRFVPLLGSD